MEFYDVIHPDYKEIRRLCATARTGYGRYYAFPAILHRDEDTVLIAFKNGISHGWETEAAHVCLEQAVFDVRSQRITRMTTVYDAPDKVPQMGEYVQMPNGDICLYIDMQSREAKSQRTGMEVLRSQDGGLTYGAPARVGVVDGVEYGYPLSFCERDGRVYMLAMTFPYLQGSKNRRQVHVISSDDNGASWHFEVNLTEMLKLEFNESALIATREGFALFTRGEAPRHEENHGSDSFAPACLVMLDSGFRVLRMRDYHATRFDFSQVGRPRIYLWKDRIFLITRQHIQTGEGVRMALDLFALDPQTLEIQARFRLDDPVADQQDGHYANLYLDGTGERLMLRVVDYETCPTPANPTITRKPDILQYSFDVQEMLEQFKEATGHDF